MTTKTKTPTKRPRRAKETTYWSEEIKGDPRNYGWSASFAVMDGFVTIYQRDDTKGITESVLLSPAQYRALVAFVERGEHTK